MSEHETVFPDGLAKPIGFAHAIIAAPGATVYLGGQTALDSEGQLIGDNLVEQFDQAASNLVAAIRAAGAEPEDLVFLQIFCTVVEDYTASLPELGVVWRRLFGKHYPAMGLFGVTRLFDAKALIELAGIAVRRSGL